MKDRFRKKVKLTGESVTNDILEVLKVEEGKSEKEDVISVLSGSYDRNDILDGMELLETKAYVQSDDNFLTLAESRNDIARRHAEEKRDALRQKLGF